MPDEREREIDDEVSRAERDAEQAERDAERAERDAERAERDARREAGGDESDARLEAARAKLEAARAAYLAAREAHREERQRERARERERRHGDREHERARRHEPRHTRHFMFDLGALGDLAGEEFTEEVEGVFSVGSAPTVRSRNVSGETRVVVGPDGTVRVQARKRVRGSSADKAKRLLQNVEVRMEQQGNVIEVRPHLYEQDRGWLDLFRSGRVSVDLVITVPREASVDIQTVSGDLSVAGIRGRTEIQSVSGDVSVEDVQGRLYLKSTSGDCTCAAFVGQLEANTVSGDLTIERSRVREADIVTVSGDLLLEGDLERDGQHRLRTISGDVDLSLAGSAYEIGYKTMSGDVRLDADGRVTKDGRRDRTIHLGAGQGAARVVVKTVSGDLTVRSSGAAVPADTAPADDALARSASQRDEARDVLERLARGELDVDAAAAALDAARGR
ncbi:MAG TPA: DUF4097 family beta strand repeat-containing protein [Candidatus Limnocylindria bacterium]|nr:DUF4097 family beta strand repeat-containing protein [Candidatus Limnocylindria bacterium]